MKLRKLIALFSALLMVCTILPLGALPATADTNNVMTNGDLESGKSDGFATVNGTTVTTERVHGGSYALKATNTSANYSTLVKSVSIPVQPHTKYTATAWYYYQGSNAQPGFSVYIKDSGNSKNIASQTVKPAVKGAWTAVTTEFDSGDQSTILFLLQNRTASDGGVYYFDDLSIVPTVTQPVDPNKTEMIDNGDLESGKSDGFAGVSGTGITTEQAHSGKHSLRAANTSGLYSTLVKSNGIPVAPHTEYTASFWYYYDGSHAAPAFFLFIKDSANSKNITDHTINSAVKGVWTKVSKTFNSGNNSTVLFLLQNKTPGDGGVYYFDDLSIEGPDPESVDTDTPGDTPDVPGNKLKNGTFETGNATGWQTYQNSTVVSEAKYRGAYGLKLTGNGNGGVMASQSATVTAGTTYVVSARMKTVTTGANIQISDSSGKKLTTDWFDKTEWTRVAYTVTPTTGTLKLNFLSSDKNANEMVYLDDVAVVELANDGYLINGDFEVGETAPWTVYQGTAISTEADYSGLYGLHLKGSGGWGAMAYQDVATVAGNQYHFSARFKAVANGCNIQIVNVSDGKVLATKWFNATGWDNVGLDFTATGTTTRINICGSGNGTAESVYLDDATVFEVLAPSYDGYIYSGDFETGSLSEWVHYQSTAISAEAAHSGHFGCKTIGDGGWGATLLQDFPVEVGKTYKVSYWYKPISNGMNFTVGGRNDGVDQVSQYIKGAPQWTYFEAVFESRENTSMRIKWNGSGKESRDEVWVDDIKVECLSEGLDRNELLTHTGISIRDTVDGNRGLAFRFLLNVSGIQMLSEHKMAPGVGNLKLFQYADDIGRLVETGALVTNTPPTVGLTMDSVDGKKTVKVTASYLLNHTDDSIEFAVRVIDIPDSGSATLIYARPYYTYELNGETVTIYGDIAYNSYDAVAAARRTKRVLTIGTDSTYNEVRDHLYDVLKSADYDQVILGNLSLESGHNAAIQNDTASFAYHKNDDNGKWVTTNKVTALTALTDEKWEYVVIDLPAGEMSALSTILQWVRNNETAHTKIYLRSSDSVMANIVDKIIPAETALNNLATVLKGSALTDAHRHYAAALTWYLVLTEESLDLVTDQPAAVADAYFQLGRAAAHAVVNPDRTTDLSETVLLAGGDYQPQNVAAGPPIVNGLISSAMKDGTDLFDGFFAVGDYAAYTGHAVSTAGIHALDDIVSKVAYGNKVYVEGNHDAPTVDLITPYGPNDPLGGTYGVFVINEENFGAYGKGGEVVAADLTAYLNEKIDNASWGNKPIFVLSHVPLHYSRRTVDEHCGKTAAPIVKALNAAGNAGLNIIFLFGHNHSSAYDDYLGGASIYLKKGDSMLVCSTVTDGQKKMPTTETIHFTYMNAGYINNYADHNSGADLTLTMTTFRIREDGAVIITRYDKNGVHNLKSEGKLNALDDKTKIERNPVVYESSRIVTADDDQPYTE